MRTHRRWRQPQSGQFRRQAPEHRTTLGLELSARMVALYPAILGLAWSGLAPGLQWLHRDAVSARGCFRVRRGTGWLARIVARICALPAAGEEVAVMLAIARTDRGEAWTRTFADCSLRSAQWACGNMLVEAMSLVLCSFRLRVDAGALVFEQVGATLGTRRFALPLPRMLSPSIEARATQQDARVHVVVRIGAPFTGLLVAYEGFVTMPPGGSE